MPLVGEAWWQAVRRTLERFPYRDTPGSRDLRLDLLRGYCVFMMVVDHVDVWSPLLMLTGGNHFFVSAAEGFVFVSGLVMGLVYRRIIARRGLLAATGKALGRAAKLYLLTVVTSVGFMYLSAGLALPWAAGLDLPEDALRAIRLEKAFYLTDVLVLYTILVAIAPLVFAALSHGRPWLAIGVSVGLWGVHQFWNLTLPWPAEGGFYYVAAWQLLFVVGLVLGWHKNELARFGAIARAPLSLAAICLLAIGFIWFSGQTHLLDPFTAETGATVTDIFAKWNLPPLRLLACAVFFLGGFLLVDRLWRPIHRLAGDFLLRLGATALPAYIAHLPIVAIASSYRATFLPTVPTAAQGAALQIAVLGVVMLVVLAWEAIPTLGYRLRRVLTDPRLIPNAVGVVVLTVFVGVVGAQPFLVESDARFIAVPDDRGQIDRPRYQLYVPPDALARQPLTLVLVVTEPGLEADLIARDLTEAAEDFGWILVAPHVEFSTDLSAVEAARRDFPGQYRGIADIVASVPETTGLRVNPDISIIGVGRAAALAQRYALVQAAEVRAVALLSGSRYTVPPMAQVIAPPAFPVGTAGMERLTERPIDEAEVRRTRYWIGVGAEDVAPLAASPEWDRHLGTNRLERAVRLTTILREGGANVEFALFPGAGSEIAAQARASAIRFLRFASATGPDLQPPTPRAEPPPIS